MLPPRREASMVKVAVAGAAGRMGGRVIHALAQNPKTALVAAFEAPGSPAVGKMVAEVTGGAGGGLLIGDDPAAALAGAGVLIDFTAPAASLAHLETCAELKKAAVVGTTGISPAQLARARELAAGIPVVLTPNLSVGMNLMFKLAGDMARLLGPDYALELLEAHHDQKKDAPSGSALRLLDELCAARGWEREKVCAHGRHGLVGPRPGEEIGVSVLRGGDIVGEHTIYFIAQGERLELTHRASSRDTFARGAVRAALWLEGRAPGLYDMQDVLGL